MTAAEPKTVVNKGSVRKFLKGVENPTRKADALRMLSIMEEISGEKARMWGESLVGFGSYHYVYASGREGDWPLTGFSPRKQSLTIYIMDGFSDYGAFLEKLGRVKTAKSCLYIPKLGDVDEKVLRRLIRKSLSTMKKRYPQAK